MNIREQIERFDELIAFVQNELPQKAEQVAGHDLVALITNRVVQDGMNYAGGKFSPYSERFLRADAFVGKSRTQTAERKIQAQLKAGGTLNYKQFRELNNLETDKKNFEFTGEMWRKFGVISSTVGGMRFRITLGGKTEAAAKKIEENSEREGVSIIEASAEEGFIVVGTMQAWLNKEADRILNG